MVDWRRVATIARAKNFDASGKGLVWGDEKRRFMYVARRREIRGEVVGWCNEDMDSG